MHPSPVCMFVKDHKSVCVESGQGLEPGRQEKSLRDNHGMNRTSALLCRFLCHNYVITAASTASVSMSLFAALSRVIPLGTRADCSHIEGQGCCVLVLYCLMENGTQQ